MEKTPLNEDEVRELVGNRPIEQFLNPRSEIFRERRMKENRPGKEEAVKLMAEGRQPDPPADPRPRRPDPYRFRGAAGPARLSHLIA